tara:strand:- start:190 stop:1128 length:939 start_codon:yes stop_codon:yes gene_type:complete
MGPRGSALICGYSEEHRALEEDLATLEGSDSVLLCPTGYAANLAVITALADSETAIFSDALNHASIVDGCRLARANGAELHIYPHRDMNALESLLAACQRPRKLLVSDGIFSMDGDLAPLAELTELKHRYEALLVVDEAHGTLVMGAQGGGACEAAGVSDQVDVRVGTLSKAVGAQGGFLATNAALRRWLVSRGRSQIFSTALPIPVVAAAREALRVVRQEPELRTRLRAHTERLSQTLTHSKTPIFPLILGAEQRALDASRQLFEAGFHVTAIRPPTVPKQTSRLRITVTAAHSSDEVESLVTMMQQLELC